MTVYIVSYTCYDERDNDLYTWRKPLTNWPDALKLFNANLDFARTDISFEKDGDTSYVTRTEQLKYTFKRLDSYSKIIVELTTYEL